MSRQAQIKEVITKALHPLYFDIQDESGKHSHGGNESHLKLLIISDCFQNQLPVARHQQIYKLLEHELQNGLHALSMQLFTKEEWEKSGKIIPSPPCRGGHRHG